MVRSAAVAAVAAALWAGGRELPRRPRRYLVLWGGGSASLLMYHNKMSPVAAVLRRYGVNVDVYVYKTTVKGRKYPRWKLVIRDSRVGRALTRYTRPDKLRRLLLRHWRVVLEVVNAMGRVVAWRRLLDTYPRARLLRGLGIRPFNRDVYWKWQMKAITRYLKPNWRGWLYVVRKLREDTWMY